MAAYVLDPLTFYWTEFLTGFCTHLLLPALLVLLIGLLLGRIGRAYGVPFLVRHDSRSKQFFAGLALMHLCCKTLFVGYLLETRDTPWKQRYTGFLGGPAITYLAGILLAAAATAGVLLALEALFGRFAGQTRVTAGAPRQSWWATLLHPSSWPLFLSTTLVAGSWVMLIVLAEGPDPAVPLKSLGDRVKEGIGTLPQAFGVRWIAEEDVALHGLALVSFGVEALFYLFVYFFRRAFSAIVAVAFLLDIVLAGYGFLTYFLPSYQPVLLLGMGVLLLVSGVPRYKLKFRQLRPLYDRPVHLASYAHEAEEDAAAECRLLRTDDIAFSGHTLGPHRKNCKRPLVLVCASGGGLSAAAWTLAVLQRLENDFRAHGILFPYHIRLITGASGGMVGAAYYTTTLPAPGGVAPLSEALLAEQRDRYRCLTQDSLSAVIFQMVYGDLLTVLPIKPRYDRGMALEGAWRSHLYNHKTWKSPLDSTFAQLEAKERQGWLPSLVFAPMLVEDGRRLLISNLDLGKTAANSGNSFEGVNQVYSREAFEFFRLFPRVTNETPAGLTKNVFTVSTAARMSASFPFASPAVALPTVPRRRVVDAGYFDNFGVGLAAAWLSDNRDWVQRHASGVVLIQLRNGRSEPVLRMDPEAFAHGDESTLLSRGLEELSSPLEGVLEMRDSAASYRNDERLELLSQYFNDVRLRPFIERLSLPQIKALTACFGLKNPRELQLAGYDVTEERLNQLRALHEPAAEEFGAPARLFPEEVLAQVVHYLDRKAAALYFTTVTFEFPGEVSLSWYLTREERKALHDAAQKDATVNGRIQELLSWWDRLPKHAPVEV